MGQGRGGTGQGQVHLNRVGGGTGQGQVHRNNKEKSQVEGLRQGNS